MLMLQYGIYMYTYFLERKRTQYQNMNANCC